MIEQSLTNTNFLGKDGFHWFIGQVTPDKHWRNDSSPDEMGDEIKHGYRAKVRIIGVHPPEDVIPDSELPWAHFLIPPNLGSNNNFGGQSFALQGGETVFGFFLDGADAQQPIIMGTFSAGPHVNDSAVDYKKVVSSNTSKFQPIKYNNDTEWGGHVKPTGSGKLNPKGGLPSENNQVQDPSGAYVSTALSTINDEVIPIRVAQKCVLPNNSFSDVGKEMKGFMKLLENLESGPSGYIDKMFNKIIPFSEFDKIVDKAAAKITGGLSVAVRLGRKELFAQINKKVDNALDFLEPGYLLKKIGIEKQLGAIQCLTENLLGGLKGVVGDLLKGLAGNLLQFPLCAAEQLIGGLISKITDMLDFKISGALGGLGGLAGIPMPSFGGAFGKVLGQLQTGLALFSCEPSACETSPADFLSNFGPDPVKGFDLKRIKSLAGAIGGLPGGLSPGALAGKMFPGLGGVINTVGAIKGIPDAIDGLGERIQKRALDLDVSNAAFGMDKLVGGCDPFTKTCGPPKVEIFGGGGIGAFGQAVVNRAGQIVGVDMNDLGIGYGEAPYVTFIDECENGQGATGKAIIEDGKVIKIVMQETGSGYLGPETAVSDDEGVEVIGVIDGVDIIGTGVGYSEGDTITTDDGQILEPILVDGRIVGATPVNVVAGVTEIPQLTINTSTGFGALVRPTVKFVKVSEYEDPIVPDTQVIRVIDCPRGF